MFLSLWWRRRIQLERGMGFMPLQRRDPKEEGLGRKLRNPNPTGIRKSTAIHRGQIRSGSAHEFTSSLGVNIVSQGSHPSICAYKDLGDLIDSYWKC